MRAWYVGEKVVCTTSTISMARHDLTHTAVHQKCNWQYKGNPCVEVITNTKYYTAQ